MQSQTFPGSKQAYRTELNYNLAPTDLSVEHSSYQVVHPLNAISQDVSAPIIFNYQGCGYYVDLQNCLLYTKVKFLKKDGTALETGKNYATINSPGTSLYSDVCVSLASQTACESNSNYGLESVFKMITSPEILDVDKQGSLFAYEDKPDTADDTHLAYKARKAMFNGGESVELLAPILADVFSAKHYLPSDIDISVKLTRAPDKFVLWTSEAAPSCRVVIEDVKLLICKKLVNPLVVAEHNKVLHSGGIHIPFTKYDVRCYTLSSGNQNINSIPLYRGVLPHQVFVALVSTESLNGTLATNPYQFQHFDIESLTLSVDDNSNLKQTIETDFPNKNCIFAYRELYKNLKPEDRQSFAAGKNIIYSFGINNTTTDNGLSPYQTGTLSLAGKFKNNLSAPVTVVVCGVFTNILNVDKDKNISVFSS